MKYSVVVPVYNRPEYLEKCIKSVLQNDRDDLELILVDDGSEEETASLLDSWGTRDKRITVVHKDNEGPGIARNKGLDLASGEYIYFLDNDDFLVPGVWEYYDSVIEKEFPDLIVTPFFKSATGNNLPGETALSEKVLNNTETIGAYLNQQITSGPPNKLYKRFLWEGIRFPHKYRHEDAYIMHEVLGRSSKTVLSNRAVSVIVESTRSLMRSPVTRDSFAMVECGERILEYVKEKYPEHERLARVELLRRKNVLFRMLTLGGRKYRKDCQTLRESMSDYEEAREIDELCYKQCREDVKFPLYVYVYLVLQKLTH